MLSGVHKPDKGEIWIGGVKLEEHTPEAARRLGIAMIFQEMSLIPSLSVAQNIFLTREPKGAMGALYRIYFKQVLPRIGTMISGVRGPYAYLPNSVERFPAPEEMLRRMRRAGFREASWTPYTFGIAGLYRGRK